LLLRDRHDGEGGGRKGEEREEKDASSSTTGTGPQEGVAGKKETARVSGPTAEPTLRRKKRSMEERKDKGVPGTEEPQLWYGPPAVSPPAPPSRHKKRLRHQGPRRASSGRSPATRGCSKRGAGVERGILPPAFPPWMVPGMEVSPR